jgi:hypothetical protein
MESPVVGELIATMRMRILKIAELLINVVVVD